MIQRNKQFGFTFIEVMITLIIVGISLVSLIKLQTTSINTTGDIMLHQIALQITQNKVNQIRATEQTLQPIINETIIVNDQYYQMTTKVKQSVDYTSLKEVIVTTAYKDGTHKKSLSLTTNVFSKH